MLLVRGAYWIALLLIAATAMTSYATVREMLASHQRQDAVISLLNEQKMLSQRVGLLATAATYAELERKRPYLAELRGALSVFDTNARRLRKTLAELPDVEAGEVRHLFGANGLGLDNDTDVLSARAWRLADGVAIRLATPGAMQSDALPKIDEHLAERTLAGYTAMTDLIISQEKQRLDRLLTTHRNTFWALIGVIAIVVLAVFRPMAKLVQRKTDELVEARDVMERRAGRDPLTGLNNRSYLARTFEMMKAQAEDDGREIAVVQLDLDRFKQINDTFGHNAGDTVLVTTAQRLKAQCGDGDVCVRMGGDEFVVLVHSVSGRDAVDEHVRRILECVNEPIVVDGSVIRPGASAGIARAPHDGDMLTELLLHADLALYAAKPRGGSAHAFFERALKEEFEGREQFEADLKAAISARTLTVHYQPKIALPGGELVGVEALARWQHPVHGFMEGRRLMALAVQAGVAGQMGRVVLEQAISDAAAWHRSGLGFGRLALNVTDVQLGEAGFLGHLFSTLSAGGLPVHKLSLELRGDVISEPESEEGLRKLPTIRAAGIHIELDELCGTNAALASVSTGMIDRVKIDSGLIRNIDNRESDARIVRAVADLARQAGVPVMATGVGTQAELDTVMALGCGEVQGDAVAFVMPEPQMREWILARSAATGPAARLNVAEAMFGPETVRKPLSVVG